MAANLVREKLAQATNILDELGVDLWLIVARESDVLGDPSLPLVVGTSVTWDSFFLISRRGEHVAIVGTGDVENIKQTVAWDEVIGYVQGPSTALLAALERLDPQHIALNYSTDNNMADGLTYGMYLRLQAMLEPTRFWERVISGEPIASRVRSRKSGEEIRRIRASIATTNEIWEQLAEWIRPGATEREIAGFMHEQVNRRGLETAWDWNYCPSVTAGPNSPIGHAGPADVTLQRSQLLSLDFGVRQDEYCSDMQRTFYMLGDGETAAPEPVERGFRIISGIIRSAAEALKPGIAGWEVDQVCREAFAREGIDEWGFALGHQMGRSVHDGGTLLGPRWERYGQQPYGIVEEHEVYTLEIGMTVPGFGWLALEDDVVVTATGCEFLCEPQTKPILIGEAGVG
jgi:Xaa-Pro aminopeptidase